MKRQDRTAELKRTAYHEAGHAVLHIYLRLGCEGVTIVPNYADREAGSATHGGEWGNGDEDVEQLRMYAEDSFWLRHAVAMYAGAEAVRRAGYRNWKAGAEDDFYRATDAINRITSDAKSIRHLFALAKRRTTILVDNYWPEIKALAKALQKSKTLSGDQAKSTTRQSLDARRGKQLIW